MDDVILAALCWLRILSCFFILCLFSISTFVVDVLAVVVNRRRV